MSENVTAKKQTATDILIKLFVGGIIVAAGVWIDHNGTFHGLEKLAGEQGIPVEIGKVIETIGVFVMMLPIINTFFFQPLFEAIEARTGELESTFGEAERLRAEMTQLRSDYERRLNETEASAREQIQAQIREAQDLKKELMADAQRKAEEYKQQAIADIDAERRKALIDLRVHVTNLSLQATEKVLNENVDNDRNRRIIDEFLNSVEVRN